MNEQPATAGIVESWLAWVVRRRWLVVTAFLLLSAAAINLARDLAVNTDPISLLSPDLGFIADNKKLRTEFPEFERNLILVVEAPTPEQSRAGAERLTAALTADPEHFPAWYWPGGEPWLNRHGLLLLPIDRLQAVGNALSRAQPLLARLAARPDVPALYAVLSEAVEKAGLSGFKLDPIYRELAAVLDHASGDDAPYFSWQRLLEIDDNANDEVKLYREIILVTPALDYARVRPGRAVLAALSELRRNLRLDRGAIQLRVTGSVALADEEMASAFTGARRAGFMALLVVGVLLWVALRSPALVALALISLIAGLILAAAVAKLAVGRINLISLAFVVLYIGIGVNYALHVLLRYRERLATGERREAAIVAAGRLLWRPLLLSALTTAIGFFSFIPTAYVGVGELGLIAGLAMFVALAVSYTLLPAMLAIMPAVKRGLPKLGRTTDRRWLDFPLRHRRLVLVAAALTAIAAWWVARGIEFDGDPLSVRDPNSESVVTLRNLMTAGETAHRNLQVLAPSAAEARRLTAALSVVPGVGRVVSLISFLPADQENKLALLDDLRWTLDPDLLTADFTPAGSTPEAQRTAALALAEALERNASGAQASRLASALRRHAAELQALGGAALAEKTTALVLAGLPPVLHRLGAALAVDRPATLDEVRRELGSRWVSPAGEWLIQIFPEDGANHGSYAPWVKAVREIAPHVTGMPVIQLAAADAISTAFRLALLLATAGIALVLLLLLRKPLVVFYILAPLLLGGGLTLAWMAGFGVAFNFANVIALPLLLGVAVDNGIHLVLRHREGKLVRGNVLLSATARGIIFGALTTAAGFGNLLLSPHAGTASLGLVLALGLLLMVAVTLIVLPASLGPATALNADGQ